MPNFRCDWKVFGAKNPDVADRKYACVNTRSKRVFVMSKSRNKDYIEVIQHIEEALNSNNAQTFPPYRAGYKWGMPQFPPTRKPVGTRLNKVIPGNWGAPGANNPAGEPLTKGKGKETSDYNRTFFSRRELHMDVGATDEMNWLLPPPLTVPPATEAERKKREQERERHARSINYCKYYMPDAYPSPFRADKLPMGKLNGVMKHCDEYPFAATLQGAGYAQGNYSVKAVNGAQNSLQGSRTEIFYTEFRVGGGDKFWVLIES